MWHKLVGKLEENTIVVTFLFSISLVNHDNVILFIGALMLCFTVEWVLTKVRHETTALPFSPVVHLQHLCGAPFLSLEELQFWCCICLVV